MGAPRNNLGALHSPGTGYSRSRLSLPDTLAPRPEVVLLDEPFWSLDTGGARPVAGLNGAGVHPLSAARDNGCTGLPREVLGDLDGCASRRSGPGHVC